MMKCKFYSKNSKTEYYTVVGADEKYEVGMCTNSNCILDHCYFSDCFNNCKCFEPEGIEYGSRVELSGTIELPKYSAKISIGNWEINLTNKTFTEEQIKNMKEMLGWEVKNL